MRHKYQMKQEHLKKKKCFTTLEWAVGMHRFPYQYSGKGLCIK